jgi:hypothetical protein
MYVTWQAKFQGAEPAGPGTALIAFKLPSGERRQRRFLPTDTVQVCKYRWRARTLFFKKKNHFPRTPSAKCESVRVCICVPMRVRMSLRVRVGGRVTAPAPLPPLPPSSLLALGSCCTTIWKLLAILSLSNLKSLQISPKWYTVIALLP